MLRQVAEDPNLQNAEFNRAFLLMQYFGYLRRNPNDPQDNDYTGFEFWLTKLNQFNGDFANGEPKHSLPRSSIDSGLTVSCDSGNKFTGYNERAMQKPGMACI